MTAVNIDDEPLARSYLARSLAELGVEVVAEGESGLDALNLCERHQPDLLFLDIQMPDMTGMQAAAALDQFVKPPLLIFVTGYSHHAVQAFEHAAFDYLLKPATSERLGKTLERAREMLGRQSDEGSHVSPQSLSPVSRLPVRANYAIKLVRVEEIDRALAKDKKVFVRANGIEHKTYYSLAQLKHLLPTEEFLRIHASAIVRLDAVEQLNFLGNHTYSVTLTGGGTVAVGRGYYEALQKRLGIA